jgi:hypothetical protein
MRAYWPTGLFRDEFGGIYLNLFGRIWELRKNTTPDWD